MPGIPGPGWQFDHKDYYDQNFSSFRVSLYTILLSVGNDKFAIIIASIMRMAKGTSYSWGKKKIGCSKIRK